MTLKDCYAQLEGDYEDVLFRLKLEERVQKFAIRFIADRSFADLQKALQENNAEEAFRAAHTLKGTAQNLGFTALYEEAYDMTETLRVRKIEEAKTLRPQVEECYKRTVQALKLLESEQKNPQ